jgi:hypothetical protein
LPGRQAKLRGSSVASKIGADYGAERVLDDAILERQRRNQPLLRVIDPELVGHTRPIAAVAHRDRQVFEVDGREFLEGEEAGRQALALGGDPERVAHVGVGGDQTDKVAKLLGHETHKILPAAGFDGFDFAATPRSAGPCNVFAEAGRLGRPPQRIACDVASGGKWPARP